MQYHEMVVDGISMIADGENPRAIQTKLEGYHGLTMPRRRLPENTENHERWLISYADFITLLFAFFVVMYSTSAVNYGDFRVLSDSIVAAFMNPRASLDPIQEGNWYWHRWTW
jgi:hypothetical protein